MEYIECSSYNTCYPFQNKHQIHWHLESVKMLRTFKNQNIVNVMKWGRLTRDQYISINDECSIYSISLILSCVLKGLFRRAA